MNRRQLFGALAALAPAAVAIKGAEAAGLKKYGIVTVETHMAHRRVTGETLHVWLDGEDVTSWSNYADDINGAVQLVCRDESQFRRMHAKGGVYVSDAIMEVRGTVVIAPGSHSFPIHSGPSLGVTDLRGGKVTTSTIR